MPDDNVVAVMYSGGTDSTYAALLQIPDFDHIRLVTFIRRGLINPGKPYHHFERLKKAFPDKEITYDQFGFEDIYQKITPHDAKLKAQQDVLQQNIGALWEDPNGKHYGREEYEKKLKTLFMTNECIQCKVAMHIAAIKYCLENNIHEICDGSNTEQLDDGSQLEDVKSIGKNIFKRYGINFFAPVFHVPADERCRALHEAGITDRLNHKTLEKNHKIPSRQLQCTIPSSVFWTVCVFPWVVYNGPSCDDYIKMSCAYYKTEMDKWLKEYNILP